MRGRCAQGTHCLRLERGGGLQSGAAGAESAWCTPACPLHSPHTFVLAQPLPNVRDAHARQLRGGHQGLSWGWARRALYQP